MDATCRMLMTMPGIGPITAVAYAAALERPDTFKRLRAVGAWLGLTPRRFQSGETVGGRTLERPACGGAMPTIFEVGEANRRNSLKSTGPKTEAGKARFSLQCRRHRYRCAGRC